MVIRATLGRDDGVIAIMDAGVTAILGALIGASSGILSGLGVEAFRRDRDARATALAIASSIDTHLWMAESAVRLNTSRLSWL